ncbi:MAG TPA: hypothetical protein VJ761_23825 [Ktedonobacteraceae bacterium]|nr:hypothetical protein [Ktedonobacteraceae bacterium]
MSSQQPYDYYNPPPPPAPQPMYPPVPNQGMFVVPTEPGRGIALAGFILGLVSIFTSWIPFLGMIVSIVGIILSAMGQRSISRKGLAIAGLILSILTLIVALILTIAILASASSSSY